MIRLLLGRPQKVMRTVVVVGIIAAILICANMWFRNVEPEQLIGLNESEIVRELGCPDHEAWGHYGIVSAELYQKYPDVKTFIWNGCRSDMFVTIDNRSGKCSDADNVPKDRRY